MPDWRSPAFDWDDEDREAGNSQKLIARHNVYPEEAEQVFYNGARIVRRGENERGEPRYHAYGQDDAGRYLFLVFVLRGALVRVYSARDMGPDERRSHRRWREARR